MDSLNVKPCDDVNDELIANENAEEVDDDSYSNCETKSQVSEGGSSEKIIKSLNVFNPPALFNILLQKRTNLNEPPSNWLHGSSRWQRNVNQGSFPFGNFFSSLNMANQFLDLTGIVDVISDSKNIKKLLKMTLSKANVSMIVHRVNNTLLLDNFDIHSLLKEKTGPWELFRRFYFEKVAEDVKLSVVERKNKSRDHLQSQNMFSKLLYYCLADGQQSPDSIPEVDSHPEPDSNILSQRTVVWNFEDIRMLIGTDLPIFGGGTHPCVSLKLRDMRKPISVLTGLDNWLDNLMCNVPDLAMCYHDNGIVQSYEVLKTEDIPNCPDCRFSPNVIKDIAQNILSFLKSNATKEGHTYWLFKAHGGDIVKLYDLTTLCCNDDDDDEDGKTSEPEENPFTIPVGVLFYRLARNLRIRQKCPSRGKKAMVVRQLLQNSLLLLEPCKHYQVIASCHYFLSDLFICDHLEEEPSDSESSESDIDLSPQADLCDEEKECKTSKSKKGLHEPRYGTSFIRVEALSRHRKSNKKQSHLNKKKETLPKDDKVSSEDGKEDPFKVFSNSLDHISQTFKNVDRFHSFISNDSSSFYKTNDNPNSKPPQLFEELAQCNPNEAIPLHYSPLKPTALLKSNQVDASSGKAALKSCGEVCEKKQSLAKSLKDIESPFSNTSIDASHWLQFSKIFLLRKAAVVFIKRAKLKFEKSKDVDVSLLQDGINAVKCYCAFSKRISSTFLTFGSSKRRKNLSEEVHRKCCHDPFLFSCISKVLGDAYLKHATCDFHAGDERIPSDEEQNVLDLVESYITAEDVPFKLQVSDDQRESFAQCLYYYGLARSIAEDFDMFSFSSAKQNVDCNVPNFVTDLLKRKANVCNEYGKFLVHEVFLAGDTGSLKEDWVKELDSAQENYRESYKIFKQLNDKTNAALVLLNETNSLEVRAKIIRKNLTPDEQKQFSEKEKTAYQQAEACLMEGLSLLENRKKDKDFYDTFMWELASINVEVGCLLQDCLSVGTYSEESVKDMMACFNKALKFSTFERNSNKHELSLYRKGHIHHRLGAFYLSHATKENQHPSIEDLVDAYKHYEISINLFVSVKADVELLKVLLEKIVLLEMTSGVETQLASRLESAFDVLETLLKCSGPMNDIVNILQETSAKLSKPSGHSIDTDDLICDLRNIAELVKLCDCLRNKLSSVLLCLVKLCRMRSGECKQFAHLKSMYNKCLLNKAISFPWNNEMQNWMELATKVKSIQKCIIIHNSESDCMNVYAVEDNSKLEDLPKMGTGLKSEGSKSIIMSDPLVVIPFSKVRELLSACRSLSVLFSEFQTELPLAKVKK